MGIVGPNGAGKTTLFKMLVKQLQPDEGTLTFGSTVNIGYVDQERSSMQHEKKTVWEAISNGLDIIKVGKFEIPSRSYIGRFNFRGSDQQKFVNNLSGGERGRLHLAASLINGSNVLLLDEPSNDLDVETLRALEDAILEFAGSVIVISHDRWFLDRICTHILAFEGDSKVIFFEGNYSEYESDKLQRLGDNEIKPKKLNFKFFS
jgi:sulfate-transporting ATPase